MPDELNTDFPHLCNVCAKREVADHSAAYCEQCAEIKRNNDRFARFMRTLFGDRRE